MNAKHLFIICIALLAVGCTSNDANVIYMGNTDENSAQVNLAEAADSASQSLTELAAIEKANNPRSTLSPPPNPANIGMAQLASIDWTGPIEPLVKKLAETSQYRLHVLGKKPAIPVIVSLTDNNMPVADILRDVSFQAVKKADILIYPSRRVIELRYLNH